MHSRIDPASIQFTPHEIARVNRARVAWNLHITPAQVDAMPYQDYLDLVNVHTADERAKR